jgi:two-component system, chemotaxis family, chemotaxis protein CheY
MLMSVKVLIIDDSSLARRTSRQLLEQLGYSVEEAVDGPEGLERYVIHQHDVVLLDMVMHGMYGLDVLKRFRELNPKLPVIIVTADIQKSTREAAREAGAAGLVNKPLKKEELTSVLQTILAGGNTWS